MNKQNRKQARKQARREALRARLSAALADIYGNARTPWTDDAPGFIGFWDWLGDYAHHELEYMTKERFGLTRREASPPRWYSAARRLAQAREKFPRPEYESQVLNEAKNNLAFPRGEWERVRAPLIRDGVGRCWSHGRNGKTIYPEAWAESRIGGLHVNEPAAGELNAEALTDAVLWLEAFNAHVRSVAADAPHCYRAEARDALADAAHDIRASIKRNRAAFAALARELRELRGINAPAACEVLRGRLDAIRAAVRDAARELRETVATLRALESAT